MSGPLHPVQSQAGCTAGEMAARVSWVTAVRQPSQSPSVVSDAAAHTGTGHWLTSAACLLTVAALEGHRCKSVAAGMYHSLALTGNHSMSSSL